MKDCNHTRSTRKIHISKNFIFVYKSSNNVTFEKLTSIYIPLHERVTLLL